MDYTLTKTTALDFTALSWPYTLLHILTLPFPVLHSTKLHYNAPHCTQVHFTALHCTALYCAPLHYTVLHFTAQLQWNFHPSTTLKYTITLHWITQDCPALTYPALLYGFLSWRSAVNLPNIFMVSDQPRRPTGIGNLKDLALDLKGFNG